jgi:hypothetical protein
VGRLLPVFFFLGGGGGGARTESSKLKTERSTSGQLSRGVEASRSGRCVQME